MKAQEAAAGTIVPAEAPHPQESRGGKLILITSCMTSFALITVLSRVWIRSRMTRGGLWWDDWMIVLAMAMSITHGVLLTSQVKFGLGQHEYALPAEKRESWATTSSHLFYFAQMTYFAMFGIIKASIILFILRLASTTHRKLRLVALLTMAFVVMSTLACVFAGMFQCSPIPAAWDRSIKDGKCINRPTFFLSNAILNIVSDVVIYLLPMRTLWNVKLPLRQRVGLIFVFAVGFFVVLTGILRLSTLKEVSVSKDITFDNVPSMWWTEAEFNIAIVCACLPSLKPLVHASRGTQGNQRLEGNRRDRRNRASNSNYSDFEFSLNYTNATSMTTSTGKGSKNSTVNASRNRNSEIDLPLPANSYRPHNVANKTGTTQTRCQSPSVWLNRNSGYVARVLPGVESRDALGSDPHASLESLRPEEVEAREEIERHGICKTTRITIISTGDDDGELCDSKSGTYRSQ